MPSELFMRRVLNRLAPDDHISDDILREFPLNQVLRVKVTYPRNIKHHRQYWALIGAVFPEQDAYVTPEALHEALKKAVGLFDMVPDLETGALYPKTRSIKLDKMDEPDFQKFYEKAVRVILTKILPRVSRRDLDERVLDIMAGSQGRMG